MLPCQCAEPPTYAAHFCYGAPTQPGLPCFFGAVGALAIYGYRIAPVAMQSRVQSVLCRERSVGPTTSKTLNPHRCVNNRHGDYYAGSSST